MEMKRIQIINSYKIWRPSKMKLLIKEECREKYGNPLANKVLNRSYSDMYCEWWWHNIGYYLTLHIGLFRSINIRCRDVDLEEC